MADSHSTRWWQDPGTVRSLAWWLIAEGVFTRPVQVLDLWERPRRYEAEWRMMREDVGMVA